MSRTVDPAYRHHDKRITSQPLIALKGARLKWHDIAPAEAPVAADIHDLARAFLAAEAKSPRWDLGDELGFVLLHRCGEEFYFLIVCTWRGNNELWETVYYKPNAVVADFTLFPQKRRHKGTYCVWEMGAVWHETLAWKAYLASVRGARDADGYLGAQLSGAV